VIDRKKMSRDDDEEGRVGEVAGKLYL